MPEPDPTAAKIQELLLSGAPRGERARIVHSQRSRLFLALASGCRELGYEALSVDEIARRAQLSKTTLYEHFGSKDGVLATAVEEFTEIAVATARRGFPERGSWEDLLEVAMRALCESAVAEPELARLSFVEGPVILRAEAGEATADRDQGMAEGRASRLPSPFGDLFAAVGEVANLPDLPDEITRVALAGGLQTPLANRLLGGTREEILELAPALADFAIRTFGDRRRSGVA